MIYFSELKGKEVYTEDEIKIGNIEDLIFLASEKANITKLVIRNFEGNKLIVPIDFLKKINHNLILRKDYEISELAENELLLVKNLLDKQIIELLSESKRKEILQLKKLSKTPIGEILTSEFLTVFSDDTAGKVIDKIKKETSDFSYISAIYVVNRNNQLIGAFSLHEILLQDLNTPVYKFMVQNLVILHLTTPLEIAFKKIIKYKLASLPVLDNEKHILGIITVDDVSNRLVLK